MNSGFWIFLGSLVGPESFRDRSGGAGAPHLGGDVVGEAVGKGSLHADAEGQLGLAPLAVRAQGPAPRLACARAP